MNDHPLPSLSRPPRGAWRRPRWHALRLWSRVWHTALVAEDAYETTRARGAPRDVAAGTAFRALTDDDRPALPEITADAQSPLVDTRAFADHEAGTPGSLAPRGVT